MRYKIEVRETWVRVCEVEAESENEAVEIMEGGEMEDDATEYVSTQSVHVTEIKPEPQKVPK